MELLAASFDWDASLRDPKAALAYLGRRPEEKLDYEERLWGPSGASGGWGGFRDGVPGWGSGMGLVKDSGFEGTF